MKILQITLLAGIFLSGGFDIMTGEQTVQQAAIKAAAENPWRARYAWFWYNSAEIWQFTQADMDAKVKKYADAENGLITWSEFYVSSRTPPINTV